MSTDSSHRTRTNRPQPPPPAEVVELRSILDMLGNFASSDQRARYLLSSDWYRETVRREQYLTMDRDYWRRRAEQAEAKLAKLNTVSSRVSDRLVWDAN